MACSVDRLTTPDARTNGAQVPAASRMELLKAIRSCLALMEYYDSLAAPPAGLRHLLLGRLLETLAALNTIIATENADRESPRNSPIKHTEPVRNLPN